MEWFFPTTNGAGNYFKIAHRAQQNLTGEALAARHSEKWSLPSTRFFIVDGRDHFINH
jgi:hypothetical protein